MQNTLESALQPKYETLILEESHVIDITIKYKMTVLVEKWNVIMYRLKKWIER